MYLCETLKSSGKKKMRLVLSTMVILANFHFLKAALPTPEDSLLLVAKNPEAKASSIYQIDFEMSKAISPRASIHVKLPEAFDLSSLLVVGSNTINGGFEMMIKDRTITLQRSGLGREIKPNEKVDVKFAIIKNPTNPGDNYLIEIEVFDDSNKSIIHKQESLKILPIKE